MIEPLLELLESLGWAQTLSVGLLIANVVQWRMYMQLRKSTAEAFAKQNDIINDLQEKRIEDFERILDLSKLTEAQDEPESD